MNRLIESAKRGEADAQAEIWRRVKRAAYKSANKYAHAAAICSGTDREDLEQCAALGVFEAIKIYDPTKGNFIALVDYCVRHACRNCLGLNGRARLENYSTVPIDEPSNADPDGLTLAEKIPDPAAAAALTSAEDAIDQKLLRSIVAHELEQLPGDMAAVVRLHDLQGIPLQEVAEMLCLQYARVKGLRRAAFAHLRRRQPLKEWYKPSYHRHKSVAAFRSTWSSVVEDEVIRMVDGFL